MTTLLAAASILTLLLTVAGLADEDRRTAITACWYGARYAVTFRELAAGTGMTAAALAASATATTACLTARALRHACEASTTATYRLTPLQEMNPRA